MSHQLNGRSDINETGNVDGQDCVGLWREVIKPLEGRSDFIRTACVLEATAPKVGNVHPAESFHDLTFDHFVLAAVCAAESLGQLRNVRQVGPAIRSAVRASRLATGTNVNLGIVLLLGPLLASEPETQLANEPENQSASEPETQLASERSLSDGRFMEQWRDALADLLANLTPTDGGFIAAAIADAQAGGMETADIDEADPFNIERLQSDEVTPPPYDVMEAMRSAASRDQIAKQYAEGYRDLFETVVPTIKQSVEQMQDLLSGIVLAHIRLIADSGDSLVTRKCGPSASLQLQEMAKQCLGNYGPQSIKELDGALRGNANRMNPGATADLIAAGLYVCLRTSGRTINES